MLRMGYPPVIVRIIFVPYELYEELGGIFTFSSRR
jgi:hypothetical protein